MPTNSDQLSVDNVAGSRWRLKKVVGNRRRLENVVGNQQLLSRKPVSTFPNSMAGIFDLIVVGAEVSAGILF